MTLAIAHAERHRAGLDCLVERRPPFSPDDVTQEFAAVLTQYGIKRVTGDRYGGGRPRERVKAHRIAYDPPAPTKSAPYPDAPLGPTSRPQAFLHGAP